MVEKKIYCTQLSILLGVSIGKARQMLSAGIIPSQIEKQSEVHDNYHNRKYIMMRRYTYQTIVEKWQMNEKIKMENELNKRNNSLKLRINQGSAQLDRRNIEEFLKSL